MDIRNILITDVQTLFLVSLTANERKKINHRGFYGLTFVISGEIVYTLNEKEYISDREHLLFLPKGQTYSLHCTESGLFPVINFEIANAQSFSQIMTFRVRDNLSLHNLFWELEMQAKSGDSKNRLYRMSLLYQLLSYAIIPDEEQQSSPKRLILQPAIEYLENNYDNSNLNNALLSKKACISEVYFRKLFKEEYGLSPKQYVQKIRINKAKELLRSEYLSVTTVAEMVGYSSIFNFSKAFKTQTGYAPSDYLKGLGDGR
jgi:AraC-like DNA-binding protein